MDLPLRRCEQHEAMNAAMPERFSQGGAAEAKSSPQRVRSEQPNDDNDEAERESKLK